MIEYRVINWDSNKDEIEHMDIMPYLYGWVKREMKKQKIKRDDLEIEWLEGEINRASRYMYWARCQYEVIVHAWPTNKNDYKLDVYEQIKMNIKNITKLMYDDLKKSSRARKKKETE